jgi:hypothetical protein
MDKDLKKLITEAIKKTFAEAPEKLIERGLREIQYDICPHCKTEIHERHEYTEDGGTTWRHSDCKGLIARPETPLEEVNQWIRPYVSEARKQRNEARKELGYDNDLGGYEPLAKDNPSSAMMAVNTTNLTTEEDKQGKSIMDVLPQLIKIAEEGTMAEKMAAFLLQEGWTEDDWAHESIRYLYGVDAALTTQIRNAIRGSDRGVKNKSETATALRRMLAARKKYGNGVKEEEDPYQPDDQESGKTKHPDNDPTRPSYDSSKPTILFHPHPKELPQHGVNEGKATENEESKPVASRGFERFANNMMNFVNASNIPLNVTVTEFTAMADNVHAVKTYIVRADNG